MRNFIIISIKKSLEFKSIFINYVIKDDRNFKDIIIRNIDKKDIDHLNNHILIIGSLFKLISYVDDNGNKESCNKFLKIIKILYKQHT